MEESMEVGRRRRRRRRSIVDWVVAVDVAIG
jgi:hypothetical protein